MLTNKLRTVTRYALINTNTEYRVLRRIYKHLLIHQHKLYGYSLPELRAYIADCLTVYTVNNNL